MERLVMIANGVMEQIHVREEVAQVPATHVRQMRAVHARTQRVVPKLSTILMAPVTSLRGV